MSNTAFVVTGKGPNKVPRSERTWSHQLRRFPSGDQSYQKWRWVCCCASREERETPNLTPQGLTKLRSLLMKAKCVWFSTLCWAERKAERLGAFSNRIEKGSRAFVVVVACFPVYQEITFLNACWKWKSHWGENPFWFGACSHLWFCGGLLL